MALTDNLNAYYKLDESSGNAADATGNGYTLTNTNTVAYASGKINNGADFGSTNVDKYLTTTSLLGLTGPFTDRTYSFWFKPIAIPDGSEDWIFDHSYDAENREIGITYNRSGSTYTVLYRDNGSGTGGGQYSLAQQLTAGTWYMLSLKRISGVYHAFLNGSEVGNWTNSDITGASGPTDAFSIGTLTRFTPLAIDGMIDEFGVWSRALSDSEIVQLYNGGSGLAYPLVVTPSTTSKKFTGLGLMGVGA